MRDLILLRDMVATSVIMCILSVSNRSIIIGHMVYSHNLLDRSSVYQLRQQSRNST